MPALTDGRSEVEKWDGWVDKLVGLEGSNERSNRARYVKVKSWRRWLGNGYIFQQDECLPLNIYFPVHR